MTASMRSLQPPDVGRQVMSELGMLADELDALPDALLGAGLARPGLQSYLDTVQDYLGLAKYAWEAVAEEQLEQVGIETAYRDATVDVARRINNLKQECANTPAVVRGRRPFLWGRRVALIRLGLRTWRGQLEPVPNPLRLGRALFIMQGQVGLASAGALELAQADLLVSATGALLGLLAVGALLLLIAAIVAGSPALALAYGVASFISLAGLMATLLIGLLGPLPLGPLLGASIFVPASAACLGWQGSRVTAGLLRAWWLLVGSVAVLAIPLSLALGGALLDAGGPLPVPATALAVMQVGGRILFVALALPAAVCAAALAALALPFMAVAAVRFARELAGNRQWVPLARRYSLAPALTMAIFVTVALLSGAWWLGMLFAWQRIALVPIDLLALHGVLTLRFLLFGLVVGLPYVLLLDLPYRLGTARWRAQRLATLGDRRADLESQVRRLATQPATDQILRAMQYDLVLLQFYRGQMDEARTTALAPFRIEGRFVALTLAVASALALDGGGPLLLRLLMPH
jgi:hypothetical protein